MNSARYLSTLSSLLYLAAASAPAFSAEGVLPDHRVEGIENDVTALAERERQCGGLAITGVTDEVTDRATERAFATLGCDRLVEDEATLHHKPAQ
jgi:hypothetical protein